MKKYKTYFSWLLLFAILVISIIPYQSRAAISLVQKAKNTGALSASATWPVATTNGNFLVATIMGSNVGVCPVFSVPAGWSLAVDKEQNGMTCIKVAIYYKANAASEASTGNFSIDVGDGIEVIVAEYSGVATSSVVDATSSGSSGADTNPLTGSVITTNANDLLIGVLGATSSPQLWSNPMNSFTIQDSQNGWDGVAMLDRIVSSTGTYSSGADIVNPVDWVGAVAAFKAVSASVSVSGTVYTDHGITTMGSGKTVSVSINGAAAAGNTTTAVDGTYTVTGLPIVSGDVVTVYLDDNTEKGVTVTVGNGLNLSNIDLYQDYLMVRQDNGGSLTNAHLDTSDNNGDGDLSAIYGVSGGALTTLSGKSLTISASHTYAPGGNVNIGGHFRNNGTYTKGTETITLTGTSSYVVKTNGSSLYNLTQNGVGGIYTLQDALVIANNFTITNGTFDVSASNYGVMIGGNYSNAGTMTSQNGTFTFNATATGKTLTSGGSAFYNLLFDGVSGGWSLQDDAVITGTLTITNGNVNANDKNVTTASLASSNTNTRVLSLGNGTWTLSGTGTVWDLTTTTGLTLNQGTSTMIISDTSSSSKTFIGGGKTYYNFSITSGGSGACIIQGDNTFNNITLSGPKTVTFASSSTQTINGNLSCTGFSSNLITINASSAGSSATLSKASGTVSCNYISLQDSLVSGGVTWNVGCNGINVSGNSGWNFETCISGSGGGGPAIIEPPILPSPSIPSTPTPDNPPVTPPANQPAEPPVIQPIIPPIVEIPPTNQPIKKPPIIIVPPVIEPQPSLPENPEIPLPPPIEKPRLETPPSRSVLSFFDIAQSIIRDLKKILTTPFGLLMANILATIGIIGAILTTIATLVSSFSLWDIVLSFIRFTGGVLTGLGIKREIKHWGITYDSVTKQPLDPAYVVLSDLNGKEIASTVTDIDGRYGLLVPPGLYRLTVNKTNYAFPSKKMIGKNEDELYKNLYYGDVIEIKTAGEVLTKNIPLDPVKFDWNEFAKKNKTFMKFYSRWDIWLRKISDISFIIGFFVAMIAFLVVPQPYNSIIFALYLILLLLRMIGIKPKSFGHIIDRISRIPLSFAIVRIMMPGTSIEISHKVADQYGRYYCLMPKGKYYVKIEKKNPDGSYTLMHTSETIDASKTGIIKQKFEI